MNTDIFGVPVMIDWSLDGNEDFLIDVFVGGVCVSDWMDHFPGFDREVTMIVRNEYHNQMVDERAQS